MSDSALHPTSPFNEFASIGETVEDKVDTTEDQEIAEMAKSAGWKHMEKLITEINTDLDNLVTQAISSGYNYEEIGRKTLVKELVKGVFERLTNRVANARESINK